jgi:hypothetical protein
VYINIAMFATKSFIQTPDAFLYHLAPQAVHLNSIVDVRCTLSSRPTRSTIATTFFYNSTHIH